MVVLPSELSCTMMSRQGREPTCPMCNAIIELEILYRLPLPYSLRQAPNSDPLGPQLPPHHPVSLHLL